uniref:t-SNARE coiled-coil homology domain-containing protein n=1 Tax=Leptocylindrus danicus TaxID=163516 RepID=A0A7S2P3Q0_9STRA
MSNKTMARTSKGGGKYQQVPISGDSDDSDNDDDFIQRQIKDQRQQLQKQDEGLEMLSLSATRLGELSMNISTELDAQNKMLNDMENDLSDATDNLDYVTRKTKELIQKSGGKKNFCIILGLIGVIVVLFFLIVYT